MFGLLVFLSLPDCDFRVGEVALVAESLLGAGRQAAPHLDGLAFQELGVLCGDEALRQSQICKDCLSEKLPSARLFFYVRSPHVYRACREQFLRTFLLRNGENARQRSFSVDVRSH